MSSISNLRHIPYLMCVNTHLKNQLFKKLLCDDGDADHKAKMFHSKVASLCIGRPSYLKGIQQLSSAAFSCSDIGQF